MTRRGRKLFRRIVIAASAIWCVAALIAALHYAQVYLSLSLGGDGATGDPEHALLKAQFALGVAIGVPIVALKVGTLVWAVKVGRRSPQLDITSPADE